MDKVKENFNKFKDKEKKIRFFFSRHPDSPSPQKTI